MQYRYRALLKAAGITYRNFHALRHTYASRCIERGVDVKSLSEMLGHADVRTTLQFYVHSSMEHKLRVMVSRPSGAGCYTKNLTAGRKRRGGREGDNMAGRMQTFDLMRELFYNEW